MMGEEQIERLRAVVHGAVQGVGMRPYVYRLATEMGLPGWVNNSSQGLFIEVEGERTVLDIFMERFKNEAPPRAIIHNIETLYFKPEGSTTFEIRHSEAEGQISAIILPDISTCDDCLKEVLDPNDRRYLYPFTNCTNCGPRFSIIEALPYDRANTTMKLFEMCPECQAEYDNPFNRRFHAQPNACSTCGPQVELWNVAGSRLASHHQAIRQTADAIRAGYIVAVKGLGGFHLMADATNEEAIQSLRQRKHREEKPLALMYPTLEMVKRDCVVSALEEALLNSPESPIVLLRKLTTPCTESGEGSGVFSIAQSVAPNNPYLGIMLPYTPLHNILMAEIGIPVVATSGNLSDEPMCTDENDALERLRGIADLFLVHNRPIARHVDDSIVREMAGREAVMRRARGYAPLPIPIQQSAPSLLAVGAHLKNSVAVLVGDNVFISQHIGDLETTQAYGAFEEVIGSLSQLYEHQPIGVVCDAHPNYLSTQYAENLGKHITRVQHHYAHVLSCMAENKIQSPVLGISWDGTGYGLDETVWGGEFLLITESSFERAAHMRQFRLPGGDTAVKEPRRSAMGVLYEMFGQSLFERLDLLPVQAFLPQELSLIKNMLDKGLNAPITSSTGRLFDAVAAIIGLRQKVRFEGQAAMELEFAIGDNTCDEHYPFELRDKIVDWELSIRAILVDMLNGANVSDIAIKFHNTLVETIIAVAKSVNEKQVALSGGCFQNKYLTERAIARLQEEGFTPYWHRLVPPNDNGIALGQIMAALRTPDKE
jgi:hydrogenase maturation protein HypF